MCQLRAKVENLVSDYGFVTNGQKVLPPTKVVDAIVQLLDKTFAGQENQQLLYAKDFVIAYGCGWHREVSYWGDPWDDIWHGARQELTKYVDHWNWVGERWLLSLEIGYSKPKDSKVWRDKLADRKRYLTEWILELFSTDLQTKGNWEPQSTKRLWSFVGQTVLGTLYKAKPHFNGFRSGFLFKKILFDEFFYLPVLSWRCSNSRHRSIGTDVCFACKAEGRKTTLDDAVVMQLLEYLIHASGRELYVCTSMIKCTNQSCAKYFKEKSDKIPKACPYCLVEPNPRNITIIWTRAATLRLDSEPNGEDEMGEELSELKSSVWSDVRHQFDDILFLEAIGRLGKPQSVLVLLSLAGLSCREIADYLKENHQRLEIRPLGRQSVNTHLHEAIETLTKRAKGVDKNA